METTIIFLSWVGLLTVAALSCFILYLWIIWTWEKILEGISLPKGLWIATKMCIQLKLTKDKTAYVAYVVRETLKEAKEESPEFAEALARLENEESS